QIEAGFTERRTMRHDDDSTAGLSPLAHGLTLRIVGDRVFVSRALPSAGELVIGRSQTADVRVDDASVSRRHAVLRIGPPLSIEDAGSAHGTRVGSRRLASGERVTIAPGDTIDLGSVVMVVQGPADRPARAEAPAEADADIVIADSATRELHRLVE